MANQYGIVTTIDASGATVGAREFKRATSDISASATKGIKSIDALRGAFRELNTRVTNSATTLRNAMRQLTTDTTRAGRDVANGMRASLKQLGATTDKSAKDIADRYRATFKAMAAETSRSGSAISAGFLKSARSMTSSAERIERQTMRTSSALRSYATAAISTNTQMANSMKTLPNVQAKVSQQIVQSNQRTAGSFSMLGSTISSIRPLLLAAFAGFGLTSVVTQIATFDQSIAQIRALMGPDALQKDIDAVSNKARELGATTVFSGTDAAAAMAELVRAGFDTKQAMTAAGAALDLAAADTLDMATAAGITANVLAGFGLAATDATHASDVLAYAANASQTDVRGVGEAMKYAATVAKATGVNLEQAAAAVGTLSNAGLEASMAGTGLRSVLSGIVGPTKQAKEAMSALGLDSRKLAQTLRTEDGLVKAIQMFSEAQKKLGNDTDFAAKAITIFGERGGPAILALTQNADGLEKMANGMKSVDGVARQMADTMTDSLVGAWKELESATEELILQLGDAGLKGLLRSTAEGLGAFGRGLAGMSEEADKASAHMQGLNEAGAFLRNNFETLKDITLLFASVYATRLIVALTASTAAKVKDAWATAQVAAQSRITSTTFVGMTSVVRTATTAQVAATFATNGLKAALAALGGPIGIIVTLASTAAASVLLFSDNADEAKRSADELSGSLDTLAQKWDKASEAGRRGLAVQTKNLQLESEMARNALVKQVQDAEAAAAELKRMGTSAGNVSGGTMSGAGMSSRNDLKRQKLADQLLSQDEATLLKARIDELDKTATDAKVQYDQMVTGVFSVGTAATAITKPVQEMSDTVEDSGKDAKAAAKEFNQFKNAADSVLKSANPLAAASKEYTENLATLQRMSKMSSSALAELGYTHDQVKVATDALNTAWEKSQKELDPLYKKYEKLRDVFESAGKTARPAATAQAEYNTQLAKAKELLALSDTDLAKSGYTRAEVTQGIADMSKELEINTAKAANNGKQAETWETMWKRAVERIDDAFVDLWKSAFSGGKDFAQGIKDTIKQMLAEIAHANITKPLTNWLSQLVGGTNSGLGGGQSGGGMLSGMFGGNNSNGLMKTISSGLSSIFKSASSSAANGTGWFSGLWSGITGAGRNAMSGVSGLFGTGATGGTTVMSNFTNALRGFTGLWTSAGSQVASAGSLAGFGSNVGGFAASGASAASGAGSAAGGAAASAGMAVPIIGAIIAGMMANDKFFSEGWRIQGQESDITKSLFKSTMKGNIFGGVLGTMSAGIGLADKGLRGIGLSDRTASLISGSALWTRAFGRGAPKITSQGLQGDLGVGGFEGSQWADIKQKGGWFRSDKKWTQTSALDPQIQTYINGTTSAVRNMIKTIGEESNLEAAKGLKDLKLTMGRLELDKDDSEKAKQQIEAYAAQMSEDLASAALRALKFNSIAEDSTSDVSQADRLGLVGNLLSMTSTDTAGAASKAYDDSLKSSMQLYREQSVELSKVIEKYDGTVASLTALSEATASLKDTQLSLMVAFKELAAYGKTLFGGTQQSIRESLMSQDEIYTVRQGQIQDLMQQMRNETDPAKLKEMADRINSLTSEAYGMLDEEQKRAMAGGFIAFLDEAEALLRDRAEKGYDTVAGEAGGVNDAVAARLSQAADKQAEAANVFLQAVQTFASSVGGGGISGSRNSGTLRYAET